MVNYIIIGIDSTVRYSIHRNIMDNLKAYKPKSCPFEDYSMFDLLQDWIEMYSWQFEHGKIALTDFVGKVSGDGKLEAYREAMMMLLAGK